MKLLNTLDSNHYTTLFDYSVVDHTGESVGSVANLWNSEHTGALEFIGVKTGWLFGSNHVVPVESAQIDEAARTIQVPYLLAKIKDAPTIDADSTISDDEEATIYRYYGLKGGAATDMATKTTSTTTTHATETAAAGLAAGAATSGAVATGTARTAGADDKIEVALREEQLKVGKREVSAGAVRLRKIVRTEIVNQPVEIRHEDVVVERISADQVHEGNTAADFKEETIDVPLTREEVVVGKETHVTGAVRVAKTAAVETQNVSDSVRKEDVEVTRDGKTVTEQTERK